MIPTLITAQCCESSLPLCCSYCEPFQRHVDPMEIWESPFDLGALGAPTCSLVLLTEKVPRRTRTSTFLLLSLFTFSVLLQPEFNTKPMMQDLLWSAPLTWSTWIKYKDLKEYDPDFPLLQRRDALLPFYFRSISCSSKQQIRHEVLSADGKWKKNKVAWKHAYRKDWREVHSDSVVTPHHTLFY